MLTIDQLASIPIGDICRLCNFEERWSSRLSRSDIFDLAYKLIKEVPALEKLVELELKMVPVIQDLNNLEVRFDSKKWITSLAPISERIEALVNYFGIKGVENVNFLEFSDQLCKLSGLSFEDLNGKTKLVEERQILARELYRKSSFMKRYAKIASDNKLSGHYVSYSASTGRMSCSKEPLMSLPKNMYNFLLPRDSFSIWRMDFKQAELRIASALSNCENIQATLAKGNDIYADFAQQFLTNESDQSMAHKLGKKLLIPYLYGAGENTLRKKLNECIPSVQDNTNIREIISKTYPELDMKLESFANTPNIRYTAYGIAPVVSSEPTKPQLMNLPIQGVGAVIIKRLLLRLRDSAKYHVLIPRHDEVIVEVPNDIDAVTVKAELSQLALDVVKSMVKNYVIENFITIERMDCNAIKYN